MILWLFCGKSPYFSTTFQAAWLVLLVFALSVTRQSLLMWLSATKGVLCVEDELWESSIGKACSERTKAFLEHMSIFCKSFLSGKVKFCSVVLKATPHCGTEIAGRGCGCQVSLCSPQNVCGLSDAQAKETFFQLRHLKCECVWGANWKCSLEKELWVHVGNPQLMCMGFCFSK